MTIVATSGVLISVKSTPRSAVGMLGTYRPARYLICDRHGTPYLRHDRERPFAFLVVEDIRGHHQFVGTGSADESFHAAPDCIAVANDRA